MSVRVATLGGLRLARGGETLPGLGARSTAALLVYLARQGAQARPVLAELLWPDREPEKSQANLRGATKRLRALLGDQLVADRSTLTLGPDVWVDATEFEAHARAGRCQDALDLYRGDLAPGLHLDESPGFENWLAEEQEHLRQLALACGQSLLTAALAAGDAEAALERSMRLLDLDALHEPANRAAIRLLARLGQRGAAVAHFERFAARLRDELGVEPERATVELARALRAGEEEAAEAPAPAVRHERLPTPTGPFVGRTAELELIARRLADPDCRLLTLTGLGGVGKTRLAVEAARRQAGGFPNGAAFVPLAGVADAELVPAAIARGLELGPSPGMSVAAKVMDYLAGKRMLVVLDNLEHLLPDVAVVLDLLRAAPGVKILATSRARLLLSEEWVLPVGGLGPESEAASLFGRLAARVDPAFDPQAELEAVRSVCRAVGGHPLALELAASWLSTMSCATVAAEIGRGAAFLAVERRDLPDRHRSVVRLFDASWERLETDTARKLAWLAVFRGGFAPEEAAGVAATSPHDLRRLVEASLLSVPTPGRFELHELLRHYAAERLAASGAAEAAARRHLEAFTALALESETALLGPEMSKWLARLRPEADNVRAALDHALSPEVEPALAPRLAGAAARFLLVSGAADEAKTWLTRALARANTPAERARLLAYRSQMAWALGDNSAAEADAREGLKQAPRDQAGHEVAVHARSVLAMALYLQSDLHGAAAQLEANMRLDDDVVGPWWRAHNLGWYGKVLTEVGELDGAGTALDECVERYREIGNPWGLGLFLSSAADVRLRSGDARGALELTDEGIALLEGIGFKHALGEVFRLRGLALLAAGDKTAARESFALGAARARDMGQRALAEQLGAQVARIAG